MRGKTEEQLDDMAIADTVRTFIDIQARDWRRRQQNAVLPRVLSLVNDARVRGDVPDVAGILKMVWLDGKIPGLSLEGGE